jgi:glucose-6-phosphate 1-epimerase
MNIEQLNSDFATAGQLEFIEGKGGLIQARIRNALGEALISTYAGQVLSYKPAGESQDLLFVSDAAYFQEGKAIKGGVPVCWPWFGPDPEVRGRPAHGFARTRQWRVMAGHAMDGGATRLVLGLDADDGTLGIWPHAFELRIEIIVGDTLAIGLTTLNESPEPMTVTQALHSYLLVSDVARCSLAGLEGTTYIDKMDRGVEKSQNGTVTIDGEVDRIYGGVTGALLLDDPAAGRRVQITARGSRSAVVWNPWIDTARAMADLGDDDYRRMLCVETANAGLDTINIPPGGHHQLQVRYRIQRS